MSNVIRSRICSLSQTPTVHGSAAARCLQVSSKCQSGFKEAVDMNCYDACVNGGRLQPFVSEHRLDDACKSALKETPRPLCHDACVRGYRSGIKDMSTLLVKRMAEVSVLLLTSVHVTFYHTIRSSGPSPSGRMLRTVAIYRQETFLLEWISKAFVGDS